MQHFAHHGAYEHFEQDSIVESKVDLVNEDKESNENTMSYKINSFNTIQWSKSINLPSTVIKAIAKDFTPIADGNKNYKKNIENLQYKISIADRNLPSKITNFVNEYNNNARAIILRYSRRYGRTTNWICYIQKHHYYSF